MSTGYIMKWWIKVFICNIYRVNCNSITNSSNIRSLSLSLQVHRHDTSWRRVRVTAKRHLDWPHWWYAQRSRSPDCGIPLTHLNPLPGHWLLLCSTKVQVSSTSRLHKTKHTSNLLTFDCVYVYQFVCPALFFSVSGTHNYICIYLYAYWTQRAASVYLLMYINYYRDSSFTYSCVQEIRYIWGDVRKHVTTFLK